MIRVLVPLDGSQLAEQAVAHAVAIARSFKTEIHLLQVVTESQSAGDVVHESANLRMQLAEARRYLQRLCETESAHGLNVKYHVGQGRAAEEIVAYAHSHEIDLISLTAFGQGGVTEFVHGSTVYKIISGAGTSILLVRPEDQPQTDLHYRKLLVPLDGSYRTDWAVCLATSIARTHGAELMLLQVVQTPKVSRHLPAGRTERELLERLVEIQKTDAVHHLRELVARLPADIEHSSRVVVAEEASSMIQEMAQAEDVGLLVLSAHGLGGADCWLYGPVSETLLAHSTRPLLVLQDSLSSDKIEFEALAEPFTADA